MPKAINQHTTSIEQVREERIRWLLEDGYTDDPQAAADSVDAVLAAEQARIALGFDQDRSTIH
jgi:hypothetical protein